VVLVVGAVTLHLLFVHQLCVIPVHVIDEKSFRVAEMLIYITAVFGCNSDKHGASCEK
jgi:hypothetical protein